MTDREKAVVMAHTGVVMLTGEKFEIFHKYIEDIMGRPVWTHELAIDEVINEIKEKSKQDFITICEEDGEPKQGWIPLKWEDEETKCKCDFPVELDGHWVLVTNGKSISVERIKIDALDHFFPSGRWYELENVVAWMPLPEQYQEER